MTKVVTSQMVTPEQRLVRDQFRVLLTAATSARWGACTPHDEILGESRLLLACVLGLAGYPAEYAREIAETLAIRVTVGEDGDAQLSTAFAAPLPLEVVGEGKCN